MSRRAAAFAAGGPSRVLLTVDAAAALLEAVAKAASPREKATDAFAKEAGRVARNWLHDAIARAKGEAASVLAETLSLRKALSALVETRLAEAFGRGYGSATPTIAAAVDAGNLITRGRDYIAMRYIPAVEKLIARRFPARPVGINIEISLGVIVTWAEQLSGLYWAGSFIGLGSRLRDQYGIIGASPRVRRLLWPPADHCRTCPPKEGEYESWDAMLAFCGGVPGDGSDACFSNCRCRLEYQSDGEWLSFFEEA